jgi:spore coat protein JB
MTEQQRLMRKINACMFAMWELKIFLDTHPKDCGAIKRLDEYEKETQALTQQYEEAYGPLTISDTTTNRWAWVQEPWPWERETDQQKEGSTNVEL